MVNNNCQHCAAPTSFERFNPSEPTEGETCRACGAWICDECIDWAASGDDGCICLRCARAGEDA